MIIVKSSWSVSVPEDQENSKVGFKNDKEEVQEHYFRPITVKLKNAPKEVRGGVMRHNSEIIEVIQILTDEEQVDGLGNPRLYAYPAFVGDYEKLNSKIQWVFKNWFTKKWYAWFPKTIEL